MKKVLHNQIGQIPSFLVSGFDDSKKSLKERFQSLFDDHKKKQGLVISIVILLLAILACSIFMFGNNEVKQINDSLTIYVRGNSFGEYPEQMKYKTTENNDCYDSSEVIKDYKNKYPDVKLNIVEFNGMLAKDFYSKVSADIISGSGPDIIIADEKFMQQRDVYKMFKSGSFAELDEFIANDTDHAIKLEDYYSYAVEECRYKGRLYAIPLRLDFPIFTSSKNNLRDFNINTTACESNYIDFFNQTAKFAQSNSIQYVFSNPKEIYNNLFLLGMSAYSKQGITGDKFKQTADAYKKIYKYDALEESTHLPSLGDSYFQTNLLSRDKKLLFRTGTATAYSDYGFAVTNTKPGDATAVIPLRNPNGGLTAEIVSLAAINANSANKQNAYNFIKTLMCSTSEYYFDLTSFSANKLYCQVKIDEFVNYQYDTYIAKYDFTNRGWTKEEHQAFLSILDEVNEAYFKTPVDYEIAQLMTPYFNGSATYEECIEQVNDKVKIYLSE